MNCFAKNYGKQASNVQNDGFNQTDSRNDQIMQECRKALLELKSLREREDSLKKEVEELKRLGTLKDERLQLLEATIAEYEKAVQARKDAEKTVELLRQNYEAQVKTLEKELGIERRKVALWKVLTVVALIGGFLIGNNH